MCLCGLFSRRDESRTKPPKMVLRRRNAASKPVEIMCLVILLCLLGWWNYGLVSMARDASTPIWKHQMRVMVQKKREPYPIAVEKTENGETRIVSLMASGVIGGTVEQTVLDTDSERENLVIVESGQNQTVSLTSQEEEQGEEEEEQDDGEEEEKEEEQDEEKELKELTPVAQEMPTADDQPEVVIVSTSPVQVAEEETSSPSMSLEFLSKLEREISYWAHHGVDRNVFFWGSDLFHRWYFKIWSRAFKMSGFKILERRNFGSLATKEIPRVKQHAAVFCLTYEISGCFNTVKSHSKLARYHRLNMATFLRETLWEKGNFCRTIQKTTQGDPRFDSYIFKCWIHPGEKAKADQYALAHPNQKFIIKPLASGGGKGIRVLDDLKNLRTTKPQIIQNFLHNPHLINGYKWDLRAYAVVTSTVPLRAYVYSRGLVRFASTPFNRNAKNGGKSSQYLTNISLGTKWKKANVTSITWSFDDLREHLTKQGGSYEKLMNSVLAAVSVVFLSAEQEWRRLYEKKGDACTNCYKHFGLDIIIDDNMNARVIEANGQPGMTLSKNWKDHYSTTKLNMVRDLIAMVYYDEPVANELIKALDGVDDNLLRKLTESDWEYLIRYLQERKRMGGFRQVYPNKDLEELHTSLLESQPHLQSRFPNRLALNTVLYILEDVQYNG